MIKKLNKADLRTRVFATFIFFSFFKNSFSLEELRRIIIGKTVSLNELRSVLQTIPQIEFVDTRYRLKISHSNLLDRRTYSTCSSSKMNNCKENFNNTVSGDEFIQKIWIKIDYYKWIFRFIPFVRFVAVCNFIGYGVADEKSDIDIFVIVKKGRIFTVKFFMTLFFQILGVRRHSKKIASRFCLSFFVSEDFLNMEKFLIKPFDPYFAFWLLGLVPIHGSFSVWKEIHKQNSWIDYWFDDFENRRFKYNPDSVIRLNLLTEFFETILSAFFGNFVEAFFRTFFLYRFEKNKKYFTSKSSVCVNDNVLKYHLHDRRKEISDSFLQALKKNGISF